MTPTEQDKELRAELAKLEVYTTVKSEKHPLYHKDIDKIVELVEALIQQKQLEARIDEIRRTRPHLTYPGMVYYGERMNELRGNGEEK